MFVRSVRLPAHPIVQSEVCWPILLFFNGSNGLLLLVYRLLLVRYYVQDFFLTRLKFFILQSASYK